MLAFLIIGKDVGMLLMGAILRWFAVEKPVSSIYFWLVVRCRCEKYSLLLQRTVKKYFDVGSSMVEVKPLTISKVRHIIKSL